MIFRYANSVQAHLALGPIYYTNTRYFRQSRIFHKLVVASSENIQTSKQIATRSVTRLQDRERILEAQLRKANESRNNISQKSIGERSAAVNALEVMKDHYVILLRQRSMLARAILRRVRKQKLLGKLIRRRQRKIRKSKNNSLLPDTSVKQLK